MLATFLTSPLAEYRLQVRPVSDLSTKSLAGLIGLLVVYILCLGLSRVLIASRGPHSGGKSLVAPRAHRALEPR